MAYTLTKGTSYLSGVNFPHHHRKAVDIRQGGKLGVGKQLWRHVWHGLRNYRQISDKPDKLLKVKHIDNAHNEYLLAHACAPAGALGLNAAPASQRQTQTQSQTTVL
jgi:hypothetical protein